jgi:hypothetical protein
MNKNNEKRFARYWIAVLIASIIISLMGCTTYQPLDAVIYPSGGMYVEIDTITGSDTLFYWEKE